jgi:hypothetical protein
MAAGLVLGAIFLMIPGRWARAAAADPVEDSTRGVQPLPAPDASPRRRLALDLLSLQGAEFYDAVGRPDLATRYWARFGAKVVMRLFGAGALLGGLLVVIVNSDGGWGGCQPHSCASSEVAGGLGMAGGLALLIAPAAWDSEPVSPEERVRLAHTAAARGSRWQGAHELWLVPRVERDGGGLTFTGRF